MSLLPAPTVPTPPAASHELHSGMRNSKRWLPLARAGWVVLSALTLGLFIASIPTYFALLHVPCTDTLAACRNTGQATPADLRALRAMGLSLDFFATYWTVLYIVFTAVFAAIGIVIFWRRSDDRMALLASLTLVLFPLAFNNTNLTSLPAAVWWLGQFVAVLGDSFMFLFFYLFPTGRFVPRWTRWLWVAVIVFWTVDIFFPSLSFNFSTLFDVLILGFVGSALAAQIYRYRYVSSALQRQQTKWVVFGISSGLGGFLILLLSFRFLPSLTTQGVLANLLTGTAVDLCFLLIPLSIGVAILRSRLFDIDIIINRTLVYGTLTALLALVYLGSIIGLQYLLQGFTGGNQLAIVGSTLLIYWLFQPVRHRVQNSIDRRFYRRKYDAARTLAAFSATVRDEVDLNRLNEQLLKVVHETMQPAHVSLWLCSPEEGLQQSTRASAMSMCNRAGNVLETQRTLHYHQDR